MVSPPKFESTNASDGGFWEIVVADQASFNADGGLTTDESAELELRVDAYTHPRVATMEPC